MENETATHGAEEQENGENGVGNTLGHRRPLGSGGAIHLADQARTLVHQVMLGVDVVRVQLCSGTAVRRHCCALALLCSGTAVLCNLMGYRRPLGSGGAILLAD